MVLSWKVRYGYVAAMGETKIVHEVLDGKSGGERQFGRSRGLKNNITIYF
jgi:hypothetical protein